MQSPYPEPGADALRSERLYYDGVRRVQEVYVDPVVVMSGMLAGDAGAAMQAAASAYAASAAASGGELDGSATPTTLESLLEEEEEEPLLVYLAREYVWGPGDWGIDEIVAQFDDARRVTFPVQDASGDVIALVDLGGPSGAARLVTEIVYDAYGRVLAREDRSGTTPPDLRLGHKGLFFDRLDAGVADPLTFDDTRRLTPGSTLLGFVRNRTLHTQWGRWLQRDPNATGMVVQAAERYHADSPQAALLQMDLSMHMADGPNVNAYVGNEPVRGSDPMGLFFSLADVMGSNTWQAELQSDYAGEVVQHGRTMVESFYFQFADLADEQWMMVDLAMDWGVPDDLFGPDMTAVGGGRLKFPGQVRGMAAARAESGGYGLGGLEQDHLVPIFAGGGDGRDNLFGLLKEQHRGAGAKSRHGNLRALMRDADFPLTSMGMNSIKWQTWMQENCKRNPALAQAFADALMKNARFMDKTNPGYLQKMQGAISNFKPAWLPKNFKFKVGRR